MQDLKLSWCLNVVKFSWVISRVNDTADSLRKFYKILFPLVSFKQIKKFSFPIHLEYDSIIQLIF
jgi:hypothetical protein